MLSVKFVAKVAFLASLASSSPLALTKRTDSVAGEVVLVSSEASLDIGILNFALTLEHLEHQFYIGALHRFGEQDFRRANIPNPTQAFQNFHHIRQHEAQHVETLQGVITSLGGTPVPPCEYNFGFDDVHGFMALARILEKVGVSAYDGAVALLNNPDLQTAAATIDTVEARHASFIATATGVDPFSENFDVALSGDQIVTLASSVIKQCPFDIKSTLGAAPSGSLSLVAPHVVRAGREIKVKFDPGHNRPEDHFCNFMFSDKSVISPLNSDFKCKVPRGCRGDIFVAILNKNEKLSLKNSVAIIVAGPIIVNVDSSIEDSCKEFVHGIDIEWKGYDIEHDKAYDVDVEKTKDDSGVDSYKWDNKPEEDTHKAKIDETDAAKDHFKSDESKNQYDVDASKDDHSKTDASKNQYDIDASASKDSTKSQDDHSKSSYRKRGLIWPPTSSSSSPHTELPLSNETPNPVEAPASLESVDINAMQGYDVAQAEDADVHSDDSNGDHDKMAMENDDADDDHMVNGDMGQNDMEKDGMKVDNGVMETGDMPMIDMENDGMKEGNMDNGVMETGDMPMIDMENDGMKKSEDNGVVETGDMPMIDMENDGMKKSDMEKDDMTEGDMENGAMEIDDMKKNDMGESDIEIGDTKSSDTEDSDMDLEDDKMNDDMTSNDMEQDVMKSHDMEQDDLNPNDMEQDDMISNDTENDHMDSSDIGQDAMGKGEDMHVDQGSDNKSSEEAPRENTLPDTVAVYGNTINTIIPPSLATVVPGQPQSNETSSPTPAVEPDSTDDVINELHDEVARAEADQGSNVTKELAEDFLEPNEEPADEVDGTEPQF